MKGFVYGSYEGLGRPTTTNMEASGGANGLDVNIC